MKRVSLKEIAKEAGVSTTTVSFVLNGKAREKRISEAVSQRVMHLVEKMNYQPNQVARGLRTGKTKTLGLLVEDIANLFFASLAKVIEEEAEKYGYRVLYCSTENNVNKAREILSMLHYRQVDGYIITPTNDIEREIETLLLAKSPLVLMDRCFSNIPTHSVQVDNFQGAYDATQHLIESGYRKIAVVTIESAQVQMEDRMKGFLAAMNDYEMQVCPERIKRLSFGEMNEYAVEEIKELLLADTAPDAVFFMTNYLGIYGLEAIQKIGLSIPDELGVISFDDHDVFRLYNPSITCVAQPIADIGRWAVHILMNAMDGGTSLQQVKLPVSLIVRNSCANAATLKQEVK